MYGNDVHPPRPTIYTFKNWDDYWINELFGILTAFRKLTKAAQAFWDSYFLVLIFLSCPNLHFHMLNRNFKSCPNKMGAVLIKTRAVLKKGSWHIFLFLTYYFSVQYFVPTVYNVGLYCGIKLLSFLMSISIFQIKL